METLHKPVMLKEVLEQLQPKTGESYLDFTAGYGGHAKAILDVTRNYEKSALVDRDEFAIARLNEKFDGTGIKVIKSDFHSAALQFLQCGTSFDLILADFGVSSPQLDEAERGFSFQQDGPLDMRMDRTSDFSARDIVNHYSERKLAELFMRYGEESPGLARKHAREIVFNRPFETTLQLANVFGPRKGKIHPATQVFQAIRIEVNDELGQIERTLPLLPKLLNPGGRAAIITFHSLEDRLVKEYFRMASSMGEESEIRVLTKSPVIAEKVELGNNPRARSAKLRVIERV